MNFQKGLQRIFVVLAIGWAVVCAGGFAMFATNSRSPVREEDVFSFFAITALPIAAGYVLCFIAIPWVTRGFRDRT